MNSVKRALYVIVVVLLALLAGFLWGRAGKSAVDRQLDDTKLQLALSDVRADLFSARVDLFEMNFGRASQHLQAANAPLKDAVDVLARQGRDADATRVKEVAAKVAQAHDQAGRLDQSASSTISSALVALQQVGSRQ